jgi:hypothetical protein
MTRVLRGACPPGTKASPASAYDNAVATGGRGLVIGGHWEGDSMDHRKKALAALVLVTAPLIASCTNGGRPPRTTTTVPSSNGLPAGRGENCGTITTGQPNQQAASCFLGYHVFETLFLTVVDGETTTRYQADRHKVTVTRVGPDGTQSILCEGLPNSQFTMSAGGVPGTSCPLPWLRP